MLGMLDGGENISEHLSACLFTLGVYHCIRELGGGGGGGLDRTYLSQRQEASSWCASQCSGTHDGKSFVKFE